MNTCEYPITNCKNERENKTTYEDDENNEVTSTGERRKEKSKSKTTKYMKDKS